MDYHRLSPLQAARLANKTDRTIRLWCEQIPGLADRAPDGRWRIDAEAFISLMEGKARSAAATADQIKAALSAKGGAR